MRRRAPMVVTGLLFTATWGCSPRSAREAPPLTQATRDTTVRGVVRVVGAEPATQVVVSPGDTGRGVGILGVLQVEIGSLAGLEVSVTGPVVPNRPPPPARAVEAQSYEIVAVQGDAAYTGVLTWRGQTLWLLGVRDSVQIDPVPPQLAQLIGSRVYLAGPVTNRKLYVRAYGVLKSR